MFWPQQLLWRSAVSLQIFSSRRSSVSKPCWVSAATSQLEPLVMSWAPAGLWHSLCFPEAPVGSFGDTLTKAVECRVQYTQRRHEETNKGLQWSSGVILFFVANYILIIFFCTAKTVIVYDFKGQHILMNTNCTLYICIDKLTKSFKCKCVIKHIKSFFVCRIL